MEPSTAESTDAPVYETATAVPTGDSTVARLARTAEKFGFEGLVVRNAPESEGTTAAGIEAVRGDSALDLVEAIEIDAETPASASGHVGNERPERTLVLVRGESPETNRFACEEPKVDVLTGAMAGDGDVNHVLANAATENGVRIEFDFGPVLRASGGRRVRALSDLRKLREVVMDAGAPYVVSAVPESHLAFRAPRELLAVGETIGFSGTDIAEGLAEWGRLAARNRHRHSSAFVEPGVERLDEE